MNDQEGFAEDCQAAINAVETAYYNAPDDDQQSLLAEAKERIEEAAKLAEDRS
jgi:hypothetical protein